MHAYYGKGLERRTSIRQKDVLMSLSKMYIALVSLPATNTPLPSTHPTNQPPHQPNSSIWQNSIIILTLRNSTKYLLYYVLQRKKLSRM